MSTEAKHSRCTGDVSEGRVGGVGVNPDTGQVVTLGVEGIACVRAMESAMATLGAAMSSEHEDDFLTKIAMGLFSDLVNDPHALCPLLTVCTMCLVLLREHGGVLFEEDGTVRICFRDLAMDSENECMLDADTEDEEDEEEEAGDEED